MSNGKTVNIPQIEALSESANTEYKFTQIFKSSKKGMPFLLEVLPSHWCILTCVRQQKWF